MARRWLWQPDFSEEKLMVVVPLISKPYYLFKISWNCNFAIAHFAIASITIARFTIARIAITMFAICAIV